MFGGGKRNAEYLWLTCKTLCLEQFSDLVG
jgi:hypothetical protein